MSCLSDMPSRLASPSGNTTQVMLCSHGITSEWTHLTVSIHFHHVVRVWPDYSTIYLLVSSLPLKNSQWDKLIRSCSSSQFSPKFSNSWWFCLLWCLLWLKGYKKADFPIQHSFRSAFTRCKHPFLLLLYQFIIGLQEWIPFLNDV